MITTNVKTTIQCNGVFFSVDVLISNDGPRAIPRPFILKVTSGVKALPLNDIVPLKSGKKCKFREFIHESQFATIFYQFLWFSFRAILRFPIRMNALLVQSTFQKQFQLCTIFFPTLAHYADLNAPSQSPLWVVNIFI